jgi:hypothetical protein
MFKVAGVHDKPYKTKRAADKRFLKAFKDARGSVDPDLDLGI